MVPGRSTWSLDRMNTRHLALAIILAWITQAYFLFPLPSDVVAKMAAGSPEMPASVVASYEQNLWLGWFTRVALILFGVVAGILALRGSNKWPIVFLASAAAYLLAAQPWQWLPSLGSWALQKPGLLYTSVVFPLFLIIVGAYALVKFSRRRNGHAV
ncbi:hypothetical protein BWI17_00675 [Betaproteobacteria bacterium GR16-43]|nr:hypothetical protein BWI17_00675 [Betaproteobacteria bacterium GR16-43]